MEKRRVPSTEPTLIDWGWSGDRTSDSDELFPVGEVRSEPGESCSSKAEVFG